MPQLVTHVLLPRACERIAGQLQVVRPHATAPRAEPRPLARVMGRSRVVEDDQVVAEQPADEPVEFQSQKGISSPKSSSSSSGPSPSRSSVHRSCGSPTLANGASTSSLTAPHLIAAGTRYVTRPRTPVRRTFSAPTW